MRLQRETKNRYKFIRFRAVQSCNIANSEEKSSVIRDFWICYFVYGDSSGVQN
jgi:hypothetical protein